MASTKHTTVKYIPLLSFNHHRFFAWFFFLPSLRSQPLYSHKYLHMVWGSFDGVVYACVYSVRSSMVTSKNAHPAWKLNVDSKPINNWYYIHIGLWSLVFFFSVYADTYDRPIIDKIHNFCLYFIVAIRQWKILWIMHLINKILL